MDIRIEKATILKEKPQDESALGFGSIFTDYMFEMDYEKGKGWYDPRIVPYHPLTLDPSANVFHYGQEIFEGLKAYRTSEGKVVLFRPDCNGKRFKDSARRMGMAEIDEEMFVDACKALVSIEKDWVPSSFGTSLYLRPFMIATGVGLGVHASARYKFMIIASPSGMYYKHGLQPVKIYVESDYIRTAPGLTGYAKCGGNYGASILSGEKANKEGYDQVLWLDGQYRKHVEEVGAMNIFFKVDGDLYTAPLTGTVLPGVTRRSVIELAKNRGISVYEQVIDIDWLMAKGKEGKLEEAFGTGTAAVISPVGTLTYKEDTIIINNNEIGNLSQQLYDELTGIQKGTVKDTYGWLIEVK